MTFTFSLFGSKASNSPGLLQTISPPFSANSIPTSHTRPLEESAGVFSSEDTSFLKRNNGLETKITTITTTKTVKRLRSSECGRFIGTCSWEQPHEESKTEHWGKLSFDAVAVRVLSQSQRKLWNWNIPLEL